MDQKQQIAERLKTASNVLVTVSNNPSVDQLASCIGLTLALNKLGKHATAVFSGSVPSTIEFLEPEKTIETNTDSLRDFIISLDKTKADKLRYKVEDKVVKIFITPYRTSITDKDLDFSQGDFNVEVVIALGVHNQSEFDQAITSHGRILHDATIATVNVKPGGEFGGINWVDPGASSLCELAVQLVNVFDKTLMDSQMATAFLTGIVAETGRFSNERTSPITMSISAELMGAGANQQLVVSKLGDASTAPLAQATVAPEAALAEGETDSVQPVEIPAEGSGTLEISHPDRLEIKPDQPEVQITPSGSTTPTGEPAMPQIDIDPQGGLHKVDELVPERDSEPTTDPTMRIGGSRMILQPPTLGGTMSASGMPDDGYTSSDPLSTQPTNTFGASGFGRAPLSPASATTAPPSPSGPNPAPQPPAPSQPLSANPFGPAPSPPSPTPPPSPLGAPPYGPPANPGIATAYRAGPPAPLPAPSFGSPAPTASLDTARDAVSQAIAAQPPAPPPVAPAPFGSPTPTPMPPPAPTPLPPTPPLGPSGPPPPVPPPMMPPMPPGQQPWAGPPQ